MESWIIEGLRKLHDYLYGEQKESEKSSKKQREPYK